MDLSMGRKGLPTLCPALVVVLGAVNESRGFVTPWFWPQSPYGQSPPIAVMSRPASSPS